MKELLFILISFVLGLASIRYIRTFDKHEKEPFFKMFLVTCWGGFWSVAIAFLFYYLVHRLGYNDLENTFGALFVIGPVEELAKLLAFLSAYFIIRKELDEPVDGIIYISCVALGFSLIENYLYASAPRQEHLLLVRLCIATPMHICFSSFMGLAVYICIKNIRAWSLIPISFLFASIGHGVYDLVIFNGYLVVVLFFVMKAIYNWTLHLLSYATAHSPHRVSLSEFISSYNDPKLENGIECLNCGSVGLKETYKLDKIVIQKCDGCENYITTKKSLFYIFHHFAATFQNLSNRYFHGGSTQRKYSTLYSNNFISDKKNIAFFKLEDLDRTIEKQNTHIKEKLEANWWFPNNILEYRKESQPIDFRTFDEQRRKDIWRWLIYPFASDRGKKLFLLPDERPPWNWSAFILPEIWFLYNELWGIFFMISGFYFCVIYIFLSSGFNLLSIYTLLFPLIVRLISGRIANNVFYKMYGMWPNSSQDSSFK